MSSIEEVIEEPDGDEQINIGLFEIHEAWEENV